MNRTEFYRDTLNNTKLNQVEKYILFNTAKEQDMSAYRFTQFIQDYLSKM